MVPIILASVLGGVFQWLSKKITVRGVVFAALLTPLLFFLKDFVTSTINLVSGTFGTGNFFIGRFFSAFYNYSGEINALNSVCSNWIEGNQYISAGYFMRLFCFDNWVSVLCWWLDSLLIIYFLKFVWWCFCKVLEFANSALQNV